MKNAVAKSLLCGIAALGLLVGCTGKETRRDLDAKLEQEQNIKTPEQLNRETADAIESAKNLTPEQKQQLMALREEARLKSRALEQESLRLRAVLVKDLVASDYKRKEVELIKRKLRKIENQKFTLMMESLDRANRIMGRRAAENSGLFDDFILRDNLERAGHPL